MSVTSVSSANADIAVANGTTTPVLTLNSGTGANQIVKRDSSGHLNATTVTTNANLTGDVTSVGNATTVALINGITKSYYDPTSSIQTQLNSKANTSVYILKSTLNADITTALQAALNTYTEVVIDGSPGQYAINATLTMPSNVTLRGINNATIICGSSPTGSLDTLMWYIQLTNNYCTVSNLTFLPSSAGFPDLEGYGTSAIYIQGANNTVQNCNFTFSFAYGTDVYGVWCTGPAALENKILYNNCTTVGIQYAEDGASYTICNGNYILNSGTDGLQGTGNGGESSPCRGNIVTNNIVIGAGFSGIEDQQSIDGSILAFNIILNSGSSPTAPAAGEGMGISAVGTNTQIKGNEINGYLNYAIEVGGCNGHIIDGNIITESTGLQYGIFVNSYTPAGTTSINATSIVNNNITGCSTAIEMEGNYNVYYNVQGNTMKDFAITGINVESDGTDIALNICNNTLILTAPNTVGGGNFRTAIGSYTTLTTINGYFRMCNNSINYLTSAAGGSGYEFSFLPGHAGTLIENNVVNTNDITTSGPNDIFTFNVNPYGSAPDAVKFLNNTSFGANASVNLSTYTNCIQVGNNWPGGDTQVLFDLVNTATDAAYTITGPGQLVKLPLITAARVVTLPAASSYAGAIIKIWNQNTSTTHSWTFSGTVKSAANATITTLTNSTWYILESDGTNWNKTN